MTSPRKASCFPFASPAGFWEALMRLNYVITVAWRFAPCSILKRNAGEISRRARARNADAGFTRIGLEPRNQLLQIFRRQAVLDANEQWLISQFTDRRQIGEQVEIQFIKAADQNV